MEFDLFSFLLGTSASFLITNIFVYSKNVEFLNSDSMGASINWHSGFMLAWLPLVTIGFMGYLGNWWYGFIIFASYFIVTYIFMYLSHFFLKIFKLIEKEKP